jgi:twin arginine-targeting protein translocase, TatA/E family
MKTLLLFGSIGWAEVLIIAFVVLLLFGGKKIPELMKGLGKGVKSFKDGMKDVEGEMKEMKKRSSPASMTKTRNSTRRIL